MNTVSNHCADARLGPRIALAMFAAVLAGCAPLGTPGEQAASAPGAGRPASTAATPPPGPASAPAAAAAPPAAPPAQASAPAAAPPPPPIMPFEQAVQLAANNLFGNAALPPAQGAPARYPLVIDPLVDGNSGFQSAATEKMQGQIADLVKSRYPAFQLEPFTTNSLTRGPLLFIGTFTAVDKEGKSAGDRDWFRICLALVDVRSGKIVSKGFARARMDGVDVTPTAFFLDSPAWAPDPATQGYVRTCQGTRVGDPINSVYWDRLIAAAMINDAGNAYASGRYEDALDLYKGIQKTPGGEQLRVYNGIYLAAAKLGRQDEAAQAFGKIVDYGLAQNQLAVKFLFRPGSTLFVPDPNVSGPYHMWMKQIADRAAKRTACLQVTGHTSRTGAEPVNERLSLMRAQYVRQRLVAVNSQLAKRTNAAGMGSKENISGLGTDDGRDALDRRVEFKVADC
jgi:outer membrane protein OmpA-like peptidoglycan-associated protein